MMAPVGVYAGSSCGMCWLQLWYVLAPVEVSAGSMGVVVWSKLSSLLQFYPSQPVWMPDPAVPVEYCGSCENHLNTRAHRLVAVPESACRPEMGAGAILFSLAVSAALTTVSSRAFARSH